MARLATLDMHIAPDRIHFLKFILEAYDGLALLSTLNEKEGLVRILFPSENRVEVECLLQDLQPQIARHDQPQIQ